MTWKTRREIEVDRTREQHERIAELERQVKALEALSRFAQHADGCRFPEMRIRPCTCGFNDALHALMAEIHHEA